MESPLPKKQLIVLAIIALCEQTALNSISPYLPDMASSFSDVKHDNVGLDVGLIASSFALAQFATNYFWGWTSDRIGRKPVILMGTFVTAGCFVAFGFCRTLWQAVLVQVILGLMNGNQGVVSTCLGEITDRSNQSKAFTYLPVIYGLGGITGPMLGGLLVREGATYPYLLPNLVSAILLAIDLVVTMIFLEESLEEARDMPPLQKRIGTLFAWAWQFASSSRPSYLYSRKGRARWGDAAHEGDSDSDTESDADGHSVLSLSGILPGNHTTLASKYVFNKDTILLLGTYFIFQLSNITYNSLYPIFAQADPPTGRALNPEEIGLSLAFAGIITIIFQIGLFGKLREKMGNKITYRIGLGGFVIAFFMMPWVGYKDGGTGSGAVTTYGKGWLWAELGIVLFVKTLAAVGGLTSALLMVKVASTIIDNQLTNGMEITNSAPNHSVLGTLNGLAQTLSAAGRAVGPFISGGMFSISIGVRPKGEALAFGLFGGIAFIGFLGSFGIKGAALEAAGWDEEEGEDDGDEEDEEEGERRTLLR